MSTVIGKFLFNFLAEIIFETQFDQIGQNQIKNTALFEFLGHDTKPVIHITYEDDKMCMKVIYI